MKILLLCEGDAENWGSWSGITTSLMTALRARGHTVVPGDVDLYGWRRSAALSVSFSPNVSRWRSKYHLGRAAFEMRTRIAARWIDAHPDVDLVLQVGATFVPRGVRVPYALYCDSNFRMSEYGLEYGYSEAVPLTAGQRRAILERESAIYEGAACIFAISERLRRSFIDDFGVDAERVHAVHAGPNFPTEDLLGLERDPASHPPTILFVGKQFERKGGDVLLRAFDQVRARIPQAELAIAGPAKPGETQAGVTWLGMLDKRVPEGHQALLRAYRDADVFCLPTRFEPFGIVFLEAMFAGLPCVGSHAWAVPEMIEEGATGFTVPINDEAQLADRLVRLLSDRELSARMGEAGRRRAQAYFSWDAVVSRMLQALPPVVPATMQAGQP